MINGRNFYAINRQSALQIHSSAQKAVESLQKKFGSNISVLLEKANQRYKQTDEVAILSIIQDIKNGAEKFILNIISKDSDGRQRIKSVISLQSGLGTDIFFRAGTQGCKVP